MTLPHGDIVPDEDAKQYVTNVRETKVRPRRTTGSLEVSHIWTTEHHLTAAAEASAETSVSLQVRHTRKSPGI